jgi:hypothetical protein
MVRLEVEAEKNDPSGSRNDLFCDQQ